MIACTLCIDVAEVASKRAHRGRNRDVSSIDTKVDGIIQGRISARRVVKQRESAGNGVLAVGQVLVLPNPPCAVDLSVVEPVSLSVVYREYSG